MDRQLKERLIGAAILVAAAVIMVPEMFSGSASNRVAASLATNNSAMESSAESGQIKTYRIELQRRGVANDVSTQSSDSSRAAANAGPLLTTNIHESNPNESSSSVSSAVVVTPNRPPVTIASVTKPENVTPPSTTTVPVPAASLSSNWVVQIGSFGAQDKAKQIASALKLQNYAAYWSVVTIGGKSLFRVRVGPFMDRVAADTALAKLKRAYPEASLVAPGH